MPQQVTHGRNYCRRLRPACLCVGEDRLIRWDSRAFVRTVLMVLYYSYWHAVSQLSNNNSCILILCLCCAAYISLSNNNGCFTLRNDFVATTPPARGHRLMLQGRTVLREASDTVGRVVNLRQWRRLVVCSNHRHCGRQRLRRPGGRLCFLFANGLFGVLVDLQRYAISLC